MSLNLQMGLFDSPEQSGEDGFSRYLLEDKIGEGGFGTVYRAHDTLLERTVAVKVLKTELSQVADAAGAAFDEARIMASIEHPSILTVFDAGRTKEGAIFIVSKYIEGYSLEQALVKGMVERRTLMKLVIEICEGLEAAHNGNFSHLDVKPENILIDKDGKAILIDFGIARFLGASQWLHSAGTPEYMSPEQIQGQDHLVDFQSDLYAIGAILFRSLTGFPIKPEWVEDQRRAEFERNIRKGLCGVIPEVPERLIYVCQKALAFQKTNRYSSALALADDLRRSSSSQPQKPARRNKTPLIHRGLQAFRSEDSASFLDLLPGSREPDSGLPIEVDKWVRKIEARDPGNADPMRIGVIYGPSGSGKSSLLHAGIIPQLSDQIHCIKLNVSDPCAEEHLKQKICRRFPHIDGNNELPWILRKLRLGGLPTGSKLLLVIDQFEQWLHRGSATPKLLINTLRQCDGSRVQAILVLREEFFHKAIQLMADLDTPMRQGENLSVVAPFDRGHTEFVLETIASQFSHFQALTERKKRRLIKQGLDVIEEEGSYAPINISILVQILDQTKWSHEAIARVKGIEDLGRIHLELIFSDPSLRDQHEAAKRLLLSLVPKQGLVRKDGITRRELLEITKLQDHENRFDELVLILDQRLRLISPVPNREDQAYQLSHDYLVTALRNWERQEQVRTLKGFAQMQLKKESESWADGDHKKLLAGPVEWMWLALLTARKTRNKIEREFLRKSARHHLPRLTGLLIFTLALIVFVWGFVANQKANLAVDRLIEARPDQLQAAITDAEAGLFWNRERLERISTTDPRPENRWRATLPLLETDHSLKSRLIPALLGGKVDEVSIIIDYLLPLTPEIREQLVEEVLDEKSSSAGLRAACALARSEQSSEFWVTQAPRITSWFIEESDPRWIPLLEPVATTLEAEMVRELKGGSQLAAQFLETIFGGEPDKLRTYLSLAHAEQIPILLASVRDWTVFEDLVRSEDVKTQANAIIAWLYLHSSPVPFGPMKAELDSFVLARGRALEAKKLVNLLKANVGSPSWVRIFSLLLSAKEPTLLNSEDYDEIRDMVEQLASSHPDASVHAAACHLLRQWQCSLPTFTPPQQANWRFLEKGKLHLVILEPDEPLKNGARRFEISSLEFSGELFQKLQSDPQAQLPFLRKAYSPKHAWHAMKLCNLLSDLHGYPCCYEEIPGHPDLFRPRENYLQIEGFRLPTVSEWQFACTGNEQIRYSFGSDDLEVVSFFAWLNQRSKSAKPPGLLFPNQRGLHDIHGNLAELCLNPFPYDKTLSSSEITRQLGPNLQARGGSYIHPVGRAHVNHPGNAVGHPTRPDDLNTIRVVRTLKDPKVSGNQPIQE